MPKDKAAATINALKQMPLAVSDDHDRDLDRKRKTRSKAAEVIIHPVADSERRARCLADPVEFLKTYGLDDQGKTLFFNAFCEHHLAMIDAIHERAISGGDKAVAAPRGDGKSTVAVWMAIYIILAGHIRSLVVIAATRSHAKKLFNKIKRAFMRNDLLMADFPEIGDCVRQLDGAPQRAAKQHVGGQPTNITWTQDEIVFPSVSGSQYGGVHVAYYGLDSAIRGGRFEFALIDDPETREVAFSLPQGNNKAQHEKIEEMIDGDIAGLAGPNTSISRVVLTTIQNSRCYSYRVTDSKLKPTFAGARYAMLSVWPTNAEMWDEYIAIRHRNQSEGDKDGLEALDYYLANREAMELGAVVSNPHRFNRRVNADGVAVEVSAIQSFFNKVADWGLARVKAELQNDPEVEETEQTTGITPGLVARRISGLRQNELPSGYGPIKITCGIDVGNYVSHWVKVAWVGNAIGVVIDEGEMEAKGMHKNPEQSFLTKTLVAELHKWRVQMLSENPPDFCFLDSGSGLHQEAIYQFVREAGGNPWAASKGYASTVFRMPRLDAQGRAPHGKLAFNQVWAHLQPRDKLWLYNVNTEFWKHWIHERFLTPTFDDDKRYIDGSLSLHVTSDLKRWAEFGNQICAEGREVLFVPDKGFRTSWAVYNKNNHKLDAIALAAAAAGCLGVRLIKPVQTVAQPRRPQRPRLQTPDGRPFLVTER